MKLKTHFTILRLLVRAIKPALLLPTAIISLIIPSLMLLSYLGEGSHELEHNFYALTQTILLLSMLVPLAYISKISLERQRYELLFFYNRTWHLCYILIVFLLLWINTFMLFIAASFFIKTALSLFVKISFVGIFLLGINALLSELFHSFTLVLMFDILYILSNYLIQINAVIFPIYYSHPEHLTICTIFEQMYLYLIFGVLFFFLAIMRSRRFVSIV